MLKDLSYLAVHSTTVFGTTSNLLIVPVFPTSFYELFEISSKAPVTTGITDCFTDFFQFPLSRICHFSIFSVSFSFTLCSPIFNNFRFLTHFAKYYNITPRCVDHTLWSYPIGDYIAYFYNLFRFIVVPFTRSVTCYSIMPSLMLSLSHFATLAHQVT